MTATWSTHLILPNALAGAGRAIADLAPAQPTEVRALIGTAPAVDQNDPSCFRVDVPADTLDTLFWGAPGLTNLTVSWFAKINGTWEAGPVDTGLDLPNRYQNAKFPWPKPWIITVLQTLAKTLPPWLDKPLRVTGAFARDPQTWPALVVQVDEISHADEIVGDSMAGAAVVGDSEILGRHKSIRASLIGWCQTPEDRDDLVVWLGTAIQVLAHQAAFYGIENPSYGISESEDMEGALGVPVFIAQANFAGTRWASIEVPLHNGVGALMYPRGAAAFVLGSSPSPISYP